jgi:hypothetical protein
MKSLLTFLIVSVAAVSMAQCCGGEGAEARAETQATVEAQKRAEDAFLAEAARMAASTEAKKACCKSTPAKPMAKGDKGCCNAKGETAKFKVFVANEGYKFFGCEGSARKGREELVASGARVGAVQKVTGRVRI